MKKCFFQKFFCIFLLLLNQIIEICCGPLEFFCLGGQYYDLDHPNEGRSQMDGNLLWISLTIPLFNNKHGAVASRDVRTIQKFIRHSSLSREMAQPEIQKNSSSKYLWFFKYLWVLEVWGSFKKWMFPSLFWSYLMISNLVKKWWNSRKNERLRWQISYVPVILTKQ